MTRTNMKVGVAYPIDQWHESEGDVLWWKFPIEEPPYVGTPLDDEWVENSYQKWYTHYSKIEIPTIEQDE